MIAGNASNNQIFVVNNGSNNVTQISTIDNTVVGNPIPVGSSPIWAVMSTDGLFVFVVNQGDGTVSVIDTSLGATAANPVIATITVGTLPNFAFYEPTLRRVYVTNTGSNNISVINANGISGANPPTKLKDISVAASPTSVTALSNGAKAYAALGNCPTSAGSPLNHLTIISKLPACTGNLVSVIDTVGLSVLRNITVGSGAVSIDSSGDASRAYVISANDTTTIRDNVHAPNCTGTGCLPAPPLPDRTFATPSITIIRTATDGVIATPVDPSVVNTPLPTFHVPQQSPNCTPTIDNNFNKTVPMPCPLQLPFVVRTFP
jgi:YVTN family beta-propeller protein